MTTDNLVVDIRSEVTACFRQIADEQDVRLAALRDDLPLFESGLDSLCFAIVVVRLEMALGVDPFSTSQDGRFPVTFGEFVAFYEDAAG